MRLAPDELQAIRETAHRHFGAGFVIRLFGSRADDNRRGGDIDLHVIAERPELATLAADIGFLIDLKDRIGDQKIDLVLRAPGEASSAIDQIAITEGIVL